MMQGHPAPCFHQSSGLFQNVQSAFNTALGELCRLDTATHCEPDCDGASRTGQYGPGNGATGTESKRERMGGLGCVELHHPGRRGRSGHRNNPTVAHSVVGTQHHARTDPARHLVSGRYRAHEVAERPPFAARQRRSDRSDTSRTADDKIQHVRLGGTCAMDPGRRDRTG